MNRFIYTLLFCSVIVLTGCEKEFDYKYLNQPRIVTCDGIDSDLIHEALYSFESDIGEAYNFRNFEPGNAMYRQNGYMTFIYKGSTGVADFAKIASPHTKLVFAQLKKESDLWNLDGAHSKLNYDNDFVKCIMEGIQNETISVAMTNLRSVDNLSPRLLAGVLRTNIGTAETDPNLRIYVALDTYYQHLFNVDFSTVEPYE